MHTGLMAELLWLHDNKQSSLPMWCTCPRDVTRCSGLLTSTALTPCRHDGLAQQILTAAAKVKGSRDPLLALACSIMVLAVAQPDAYPGYLASTAAAVLVDQLLQVGGRGCAVPCVEPPPALLLLDGMTA
jgi:hypothetical protein